jgi:hypothetical protein
VVRAVVVVAVALLAACSGESSPAKIVSPATTAASPTTTVTPKFFPSEPGPIEPGSYVSSVFRPKVALRVEDGWAATSDSETPDVLAIQRASDSTFPWLMIVRPREMFVPDRAFRTNRDVVAAGSTEPVPPALGRWFERHPRITLTPLAPFTIGGVVAERFDATVAANAAYPSEACPDTACVLLCSLDAPENRYRAVQLVEGHMARLYLVRARGETLMLLVEAPAAEFPTAVNSAEQLISTVRFP